MQYFYKTAAIFLLLVVGASLSAQAFPTVKKQDGRVFIHDRYGEAWEVTQAASIGFDSAPAGTLPGTRPTSNSNELFKRVDI